MTTYMSNREFARFVLSLRATNEQRTEESVQNQSGEASKDVNIPKRIYCNQSLGVCRRMELAYSWVSASSKCSVDVWA